MNLAYKVIKMLDKILNFILYIIFAIIFLFSLYALFDIYNVYYRASNKSVSEYKPTEDNFNNDVKDLKKVNADVCAWIIIDGTNIDYPVLRGKNNYEYVTRDMYKNYSSTGSIFLDFRNSMDFSDNYSIIFGHNMNGGVMFTDVKKFIEKDFFDKHLTGTLYTEDKIFKLETLAFINTNAYDTYVYRPNINDLNTQKEKIEYIKEHAINYRDIDINEEDKLLALSTCSNLSNDDRYLLIVKLTENKTVNK